MKDLVAMTDGEIVSIGGEMDGLHDPTPETREYWEGAKKEELLIKKCKDCGRTLHPRRNICSDCLSFNLQWEKSSGKGVIYSFSVVYRAPTDYWNDKIPYITAIIELEEGVHIFSNVVCNPKDIKIGLPVKVFFDKVEENVILPKFKLDWT